MYTQEWQASSTQGAPQRNTLQEKTQNGQQFSFEGKKEHKGLKAFLPLSLLLIAGCTGSPKEPPTASLVQTNASFQSLGTNYALVQEVDGDTVFFAKDKLMKLENTGNQHTPKTRVETRAGASYSFYLPGTMDQVAEGLGISDELVSLTEDNGREILFAPDEVMKLEDAGSEKNPKTRVETSAGENYSFYVFGTKEQTAQQIGISDELVELTEDNGRGILFAPDEVMKLEDAGSEKNPKTRVETSAGENYSFYVFGTKEQTAQQIGISDELVSLTEDNGREILFAPDEVMKLEGAGSEKNPKTRVETSAGENYSFYVYGTKEQTAQQIGLSDELVRLTQVDGEQILFAPDEVMKLEGAGSQKNPETRVETSAGYNYSFYVPGTKEETASILSQ